MLTPKSNEIYLFILEVESAIVKAGNARRKTLHHRGHRAHREKLDRIAGFTEMKTEILR
jgi:hypothetical protein